MNGVLISAIGAAAAIVASFFTATATSDARVNGVDTKVEVLQERQALQYAEVKTSLERIELKLDSLTIGTPKKL